VAFLSIVLAFNYVDRQALGLLLQSIKIDLALSDTQLGLLTGIAFSLFYSLMGIPLARWADRGNRVTIISMATALSGIAVALCGLACSFIQLLLVRVAVGVGEAGCLPPAQSLLSDNFDRSERPRAIARYMLGIPLSVIFGVFVAGWMNEFYGWRITFVLLGLPGLLLAVLARLTLKEPRTTSAGPARTGEGDVQSLRTTATILWRNRTFRDLLCCFAITAFFNFAIVQWKAAFFVRSFGITTGELGTWFALIYGLGGLLGTWLGGEWAARRAASNEILQLRAIAIVYGVCGLASAVIYLSPNRYVAFAGATFVAVGGGATTGPLFAIVQSLVADRMRAVAVAVLYLFANLIGMGLGPLAAGALSDALRPEFGTESLRYALLLLSPGYLWGGWHLLRASSSIASDLSELRATDPDLRSTNPSHRVAVR
jgi:MFS family permease